MNDSMLLLKVGSEKSKIQPTVSQTATLFNKRYFYSVTLIDLILVFELSGQYYRNDWNNYELLFNQAKL